MKDKRKFSWKRVIRDILMGICLGVSIFIGLVFWETLMS